MLTQPLRPPCRPAHHSKQNPSPGSGSPDELDSQAEVGDTARPVPLHQDVLAFQVAVGNGRLPLRAEDLGVEVAET